MSDEFFLGTILPLLFLLIGLVLLGNGVGHGRRTRAFLGKARAATGRVIALERVPASSDEQETWRPVIEFTTDRGYPARCKALASSNPPAYAVGERVEVLYDPARPAEGRIRSFTDLWLLPLLFGGLGALFAGIGTALLTGIIVP